jgi:hypothetical protein
MVIDLISHLYVPLAQQAECIFIHTLKINTKTSIHMCQDVWIVGMDMPIHKKMDHVTCPM